MTPMIESSSTWSSNINLNLAMLSYSTGLTIPRIVSPWLLRTKIGILLLIPVQLLVVFIITIPCLFMELALGQYSNKAVIKMWDLCPLLRGVGICSFMTFLLYQTYYSFLSSCTLWFTFLSFTNEQQWKSCNKSWNKINCFTLRDNYTRRFECNQKFSKEKCDKMQWQSSMEQFYLYKIMNVDDVNGYAGAPQHELLVYNLVTIFIIFFANYGGPKSTEKFLIALAIVPTVQLIILFFTPLTNTNGFLTLNYLFTHFDKTQLKDIKVWTTMVELSLITPGLGFGAYVTLGTHNFFRNPLHFKTIGISLVTVLFTIVYNITVQNFLVSVCLQSKMLIEDFLNLEQELTIPEAVFFLEHSSKFWIMMWLSNCYMLGLRSLIVMMSINAEVLYNSFPKARRRHNTCIFLFCILMYSGGILFSTKIGYFAVKSIDKIVNKFLVMFFNTLNLLGVMYFYGVRKFREDVHFMLGIRTSVYWNALYVVNPILLGSVFVYNLLDYYKRNVPVRFPWIYTLEGFLLWFSVAFVLFYCVLYIIVTLCRGNRNVFKSPKNWGPRYATLLKSRNMFRAYNMAKEYLYRQERFRQFSESRV